MISIKHIVIIVALATGMTLVYALGDEPIPPGVSVLATLGPLVTIVYWLRHDALTRHVSLVHDWGFLVLIAWPVVIPWYVYRTRGAHGWPVTMALFAGLFGPSLVGALIFLVRSYGAGEFR